MYLIPSDYDYQVRQEIKTLLKGDSAYRLDRAEKAAADQMISYLQRRYDVSALFPVLDVWNDAEVYAAGALAYWKAEIDPEENYLVYEAIEAVTVIDPSDATKWKLYTGRNSMIVMYLVDITLYHLMSRFSSQFQVRTDRYKEAMDWLKQVAAGQIDANLPQLEQLPTDTNPNIRWGSHTAENHQW